MTRILPAARIAATVLALSVLSFPAVGIAAFAAPAPGPTIVAISTLGDLSPDRSIAQDTLALIEKGNFAAARLRIKELKTAWDKDEPNLKPKDIKTWSTLDSAIDAALADLRTPSAKADNCRISLKALIAKMDAVEKT